MRTLAASTLLIVAALLGSANAAIAQDRPPPPTRQSRPAPRQGKTDDSRTRLLELLGTHPATEVGASAAVVAAPGALGTEAEPNDTITTANPASLGDTISGVIDPAGDYDYFAIDLTAGSIIELDVDAQVLGSQLDAIIGLFDTDGTCCLAVNDDWDGYDSHIVYAIPADGRYFVAIVDYDLRGGAGYTYRLAFREVALDEIEPNDTPGSATVIALGDTVTGVLSPATDRDYFAVDLPGGAFLEVASVPVDYFAIERILYGTDGTTVLHADTGYGWGYPLEHYIEVSGRYYIAVGNAYPESNVTPMYALTTEVVPPGPGDPVTLFASGQGVPRLIAAGATGELYAFDDHGARLLRVSPTGVVSELRANLWIGSMVVDGYGDLLATGYDEQLGTPVVWRIKPDGTRSVLINDGSSAGLITIGPDGDVWTTSCAQVCPAVSRYDPLGNFKSVTAIGVWPTDMAFSPAGQLHFTTWGGVDRLSGTNTQQVITSDAGLGALAFDEDGRLYVTAEAYPSYVLRRYSATYQLLDERFARFDSATAIDMAFGRDADGTMTSRLFVSAVGPWYDTPPLLVYEMNPDGVAAPGLRIGVDLLRISAVPADTVRLGAAYSRTLTAVDPPAAVTWAVESGSPPPGITLNASSGTLSGTPEQAGSYSFAVRATSGSRIGFVSVGIVVIEPTLAVNDVVNAMLGVPGLMTPELEVYLDLQGNRNGQCDVGDLRAFLRAQGQLTAEPASAGAPERSGGR